MTYETAEILSSIIYAALPVGSFVFGLGYMLWRGI